jgi:hypothetical protein
MISHGIESLLESGVGNPVFVSLPFPLLPPD